MMIDFFGNENLPLPRMERPYGRGLRIVADATKVNEKKKRERMSGMGLESTYSTWMVCRDALFDQKTIFLYNG